MQGFEDELNHQSQEVMIEDDPYPGSQNTIYESRDEMKSRPNKVKYEPVQKFQQLSGISFIFLQKH